MVLLRLLLVFRGERGVPRVGDLGLGMCDGDGNERSDYKQVQINNGCKVCQW